MDKGNILKTSTTDHKEKKQEKALRKLEDKMNKQRKPKA